MNNDMDGCWRRDFLGGCIAVGTAIAGCSTGTEKQPSLDFLITNYTGESVGLSMSVLRQDADSLDEALVLDEEYTLEATESGSEPTRKEAVGVLPSRPYIIKTAIEGYHHPDFHFYPACTDGNGHDRVYVAIDEHRPEQDSWRIVLSQSGTCRSESDQ